jgi:hypothetical protein
VRWDPNTKGLKLSLTWTFESMYRMKYPEAQTVWDQMDDILTTRYGGLMNTESIREQFGCHVMGKVLLEIMDDRSFDLELNRPGNAHWGTQAPFRAIAGGPGAACNW